MQLLKKLFTKIDRAFSFDLIIVFIVIGLVVYGKSLFNGFVGDDLAQIVTNEAVHKGDLISIFAKGTFATGGAGGGLGGIYYKPMMTFLFAIIYNTVGLLPFVYHALNLITHLANVVLLFFVSRNFFKSAKLQYPQAVAFLLSFIFLIHSGNSETVLYIADMQDLLVAFFLLCAVLLMQGVSQTKFGWKKAIVLGFFLLCGMLSKESGIVALALIPLYAFLFVYPIWKKTVGISIAVFLLYLFLRFQVAHIPVFQSLSFIPIHAATIWQRLLTIPFELFSYLRLIVFPADLFLYQHDVVFSVFAWKFYLLLPVVLAVVSLLVWFAFCLQSKLYVFFLFWIFLGFGIVMNIIPLDMTLEERWLYLPFMGVLLAFVLIVRYLARFWSKYIFMGLVIFMCIATPFYVIRSFMRSLNFQNNLTLYSHDIQRNKYSYELLNNYGVALLESGQEEKAKVALQQSIHFSPQYWPAYSNLGLVYEKLHMPDKAKQYYLLAIEMSHYFVPYENLAQLTYETDSPQAVLPILQQGLMLYPNNPRLLVIAAKTYNKLGKEDLARQYAQKAVSLDSASLQDAEIQQLTGQIEPENVPLKP